MARALSPSWLPARLLQNGLRSRWVSSLADPDVVIPSTCPSYSKADQKKLSHRLSSVVDAVNERKLPPELRGRAQAVRSETDIANVVEQRIWRSMEEGHFENLPGKGKPLDLNTNPHVDPAEDTLYRILSKNGCAPEWVELNKEIRYKIAEWRLAMKKARVKRLNHNGPEWAEETEHLKAQMRDINDKSDLRPRHRFHPSRSLGEHIWRAGGLTTSTFLMPSASSCSSGLRGCIFG